ncbi:MAG: EF-Hand, Calmodulin [Gemmataceae bacterium]|nr:EF-Hand, Calmodulin [Gemmataceae bacterium]
MRLFTKTLGLATLCSLAVALAAHGQQPARPGIPPDPNKTAGGGQPDARNAPRFDAARFFKDHDKNNDGKLSKDELPATAQSQFDQIDTNKDGYISQEELQQYAARMARQRPQLIEIVFYTIDIPEEALTTQELQTAYDQLRRLDKNNDGKIDESEVKAIREQRRKERTDGIFSALDRNKDGKISKEEARGLWADNFAQLDKNGDGYLDREEVEAALATAVPGRQGDKGGAPDQPGKNQPDKK